MCEHRCNNQPVVCADIYPQLSLGWAYIKTLDGAMRV